MNQSVQNFLNSFDLIDKSEQWEITSEILKRTVNLDFPAVTDEELAQNAEELFLELEQRELEDEQVYITSDRDARTPLFTRYKDEIAIAIRENEQD